MKKVAQAVIKQVARESLETLKSTGRQVGVVSNEAPQTASEASGVVFNKEEHQVEDAAKMTALRGRLRQIQSEGEAAVSARQQTAEDWAKQQESHFAEVIDPEAQTRRAPRDEELLVSPRGKKKRGFMFGRKKAAEQKAQAVEVGRGAKN